MQADWAEAQLRTGMYARLSETYDAAQSDAAARRLGCSTGVTYDRIQGGQSLNPP